MPWHERGRLAYQEGKSIQDAPYPMGTEEGEGWFNGWNEAADEDDTESLDVIPVQLVLNDGRLYLTDSRGRVLGHQFAITTEQTQDGTTAQVAFTGLVIK